MISIVQLNVVYGGFNEIDFKSACRLAKAWDEQDCKFYLHLELYSSKNVKFALTSDAHLQCQVVPDLELGRFIETYLIAYIHELRQAFWYIWDWQPIRSSKFRELSHAVPQLQEA